jgi:hypothetical protein
MALLGLAARRHVSVPLGALLLGGVAGYGLAQLGGPETFSGTIVELSGGGGVCVATRDERRCGPAVTPDSRAFAIGDGVDVTVVTDQGDEVFILR